MKTLIALFAVTALTLPVLTSAESLQFKRSSGDGYDDYTGQITVSGEYSRDFDDEVQGDVVCFVAKGGSAKLIPRKALAMVLLPQPKNRRPNLQNQQPPCQQRLLWLQRHGHCHH